MFGSFRWKKPSRILRGIPGAARSRVRARDGRLVNHPANHPVHRLSSSHPSANDLHAPSKGSDGKLDDLVQESHGHTRLECSAGGVLVSRPADSGKAT